MAVGFEVGYYITSDGEDFITIFMHALIKAKELSKSINIYSIDIDRKNGQSC